MTEYGTYAENTWCPGCGNFGILNGVKKGLKKLEEKGIPGDKIVITTGIGCHGKIFDYLNLSGLYGLHGRAMASAQGTKLANPDLHVITFSGDGDAMGEGLSHMVFAAKRNADITVFMHNNGVYGLTTGQYTPTSARGFRGPSTPGGSPEDPLNPVALMLEAGATFVARAFPVKLEHFADIFVSAVEHRGFSFVDVLQTCVTFNNTYQKYNESVEILEEIPADFTAAMAVAKRKDRIPAGIIYRKEKEPFHRTLYGDWNPATEPMDQPERLHRVGDLISVQKRGAL